MIYRPQHSMFIHITGASGSGTSTLGAALAAELGCSLLEADGFLWLPTEPPYQTLRPVDERRSLLLAALECSGSAVVSGSVSGWGVEIEDIFDGIVFLYLDTALRLERLYAREVQRFGRANPAFLTWAAQYDEGPPEGRSLARQKAWLAARKCPVLVLEGDLSTAERIARLLPWWAGVGPHR